MDVFYKTHIVDPVSHSNTRTVFKVPKILLNCDKAKIANVIVNINDAAATFNLIGGALNTVKNITFKVNGQELDSNRAPKYINTVVQPLSSDGQNVNLNLPEYNSNYNYNFVIDDYDSGTASGIFQNSNKYLYNVAINTEVSTTVNTLRLNKLLGFFRSNLNIENEELPVLPLNMMKGECELIIEWEDIVGNYCSNPSATLISISRPFLILDEVNSESMSMLLSRENISWNYPSWEWTSYFVDSASNLNVRLNSLNGKFVKRLALINNDLDTVDNNIINTNSKNLTNEMIRISVNQKDIMDFRGCDSPAKKTMFFNTSWGEHILPVAANFQLAQVDSVYDTFVRSNVIVSNVSLFGCNVNERVKDIQLEVKSDETANINVNVIGEVQRGIDLNSNGDFIAYN